MMLISPKRRLRLLLPRLHRLAFSSGLRQGGVRRHRCHRSTYQALQSLGTRFLLHRSLLLRWVLVMPLSGLHLRLHLLLRRGARLLVLLRLQRVHLLGALLSSGAHRRFWRRPPPLTYATLLTSVRRRRIAWVLFQTRGRASSTTPTSLRQLLSPMQR